MRICRFELDGYVRYGIVEGDAVVPLAGEPWDQLCPHERAVPLARVHLLAPCRPGKIVAVGRNYRAHAAELGNQVPASPIIFMKPATAVIGPGDTILYPPQSKNVHHEAELAVVIGRRCKQVPPERIAEHVLGYTCANDVTARDLQKLDEQWTRSKSFDTFCPFGPWIETDMDPGDLGVTCRVNGQVRQQGRTRDMVFSVAVLISFIADAMTLEPGDLILTGTPEGVGPIVPGDLVEVEVEGIGVLRNAVAHRPTVV
ncbi:MAG: fumarylacetoacetate hydrolase family protein [Anaerolineae bacterium]